VRVYRLPICAALLSCSIFAGSTAWSQGPGGPPGGGPGGGFGGRGGGGFNPEDFFNRLDRNGNGQLDPDELQNSPMRRMFEAGGRDLSKPITKQEFTELQNQMMQRFRGGMSGRGGGPGGPGGPGMGPPAEGANPSAPASPGGNAETNTEERGRRGRGRRGERGGDERSGGEGDATRGGAPASPAPATNAPPAKPSGKPGTSSGTNRARTRFTVDLPEQYATRDANKDGQLGLYEWPKTDLATFKRLDLNGDGFITPQELERGNRRAGTASPPATAATPVAAGTAPTTAPTTSTPANPAEPAKAASTPKPGPPANPAETAFNLLDRDKDGSLTEEEWQRSLTTKSRFERAGVTVSFPLSKADFVRQYPADSP